MKVQNYQRWAMNLFSGACYAACISYMSGKQDKIAITRDILEGYSKGYIKADGYVADPHLFYNYCQGEDLFKDVKKLPYKSQPFYQIVCWKWKDKTHFVVMCNDEVIFDPAGNSNTVKNGEIDSIREFI